jgi:hypothetical protein
MRGCSSHNVIAMVMVLQCASTAPELPTYDAFDHSEERFVGVLPISNETGEARFNELFSSLSGKYFNDLKKHRTVPGNRTRKTLGDSQGACTLCKWRC